MRKRVADVLDQGVLATFDVTGPIDISERPKRGVFWNIVQAPLKMLAPHVTESRKDHKDCRCSEATTSNHLGRNIRRPSEIDVWIAQIMTRGYALERSLELRVIDAQILNEKASA
ncbi:hypothetical protein GCM10027046_05820 [Uliginosibacterium flavum]